MRARRQEWSRTGRPCSGDQGFESGFLQRGVSIELASASAETSRDEIEWAGACPYPLVDLGFAVPGVISLSAANAVFTGGLELKVRSR
jgi:hypothetical protein